VFASALLADIVAQKGRFLDYLKEADCDPTLRKVAYYIAHMVIRELATRLSVLAMSEVAADMLQRRSGVKAGNGRERSAGVAQKSTRAFGA